MQIGALRSQLEAATAKARKKFEKTNTPLENWKMVRSAPTLRVINEGEMQEIMADMSGWGLAFDFEAPDDDGRKFSEHKRRFDEELEMRNKQVFHIGVTCDGCHVTPIAGDRFSLVGFNYDLCRTCHDVRRYNASVLEFAPPCSEPWPQSFFCDACGIRTASQECASCVAVDLEECHDRDEWVRYE